MTHYTTLVERCRRTNSLLADEINAEFRRLEHEIETLRDLLKTTAKPNPRVSPQKRFARESASSNFGGDKCAK